MKKPRVRFAPSPTGALHIGGVRTALYNYLLAKKHGGDFILRIEDTDQTRYVPGAEDYIVEALQWLGLQPDEGPGIGGDYGPYRQSERKALYQKYAQQLLDNGNAYYAFDTPEELDAQREADATFKYDGSRRMNMRNSLSMSEAEAGQLIQDGTPKVIRLKVPADEQVTFQDLVRGEVTFDSNELDDKVLVKADGMPTYHMANIIDDHLMKITHVIRGEEWLSSTAHHVLLYRAFGWEDSMPHFSHLPLILKPAPESYLNKNTIPVLAERLAAEFKRKHAELPATFLDKSAQAILQVLQDKKNLSAQVKPKDKDKEDKAALKAFLRDALFGKLSKRDGDRLGFPVFPLSWKGETPEDSFIGFREYGFLPTATLNFLALLGWNPGTEQEIFPMADLIEAFSLERVNKSGTRFDIDKAKWFNQQYVLHSDAESLTEIVQPMLAAHGHQPEMAFLHRFIELMKERVVTLDEFWSGGYYFFQKPDSYEEKMVKKRWQVDRADVFHRLVEELKGLHTFSASAIEENVNAFIEKEGLKFGEVLPMLRIGVTGTMKGPAIYEVMEVLGVNESTDRLSTAFKHFNTMI
ncbi:MAG: glutamate--tRNA ligase [Chitinophagales bacterium]|nr:glutamate--tRNA ligase [Chitinophagales bacterium]